MKKKLCVVLADYYDDITKLLVKGAVEEIQQAESKGIIKKVHGAFFHDMFFHVPGVCEIPVTISKLIKKYDGFIAVGCIIKGETPNFDFISQAITNGIMQLSISNKKPIGNAVITCLDEDQAKKRISKGEKAASAVLDVLDNSYLK